jgi:hypothetical protein
MAGGAGGRISQLLHRDPIHSCHSNHLKESSSLERKHRSSGGIGKHVDVPRVKLCDVASIDTKRDERLAEASKVMILQPCQELALVQRTQRYFPPRHSCGWVNCAS